MKKKVKKVIDSGRGSLEYYMVQNPVGYYLVIGARANASVNHGGRGPELK